MLYGYKMEAQKHPVYMTVAKIIGGERRKGKKLVGLSSSVAE
jgi:hypothetical protein